jgi:hypothetical protein
MKDRVILLTASVLVVTVALFAWFTWARWGILGIYPGIGRLVIGAAVFALTFAVLFSLSRRRTTRAPHHSATVAISRGPDASHSAAAEMCQEVVEKTKVTTVEIS